MHTEFRKIINEKLAAFLKSVGFRKKGNDFIYKTPDIVYFIQTQSSQRSGADNLVLTVNIGLNSTLICKLWEVSIPEDKQRHWERRIGNYTTDQRDKWWEIKTEAEALQAAEEIATILELKVLPEILAIQSTRDLEALWQQGKSPGLMEKTRVEFLRLLQSQK